MGQGQPSTGCPLRVFHTDTSPERASMLHHAFLSGTRPQEISGAAQRGIKPPPFTPNFPRTDAPCAQRNSRDSQVPPVPSGRSCPSATITLQLAGEPQPLLQPCSALGHAKVSGVQATEVTSLQSREDKKNTDTFRDRHSGSHKTPGIVP